LPVSTALPHHPDTVTAAAPASPIGRLIDDARARQRLATHISPTPFHYPQLGEAVGGMDVRQGKPPADEFIQDS
jgi:hypothetical protein